MAVAPQGRTEVELGANRGALRLTRRSSSECWAIGYPVRLRTNLRFNAAYSIRQGAR